MKITAIPANDLTSEHVALWEQFQQADPDLASPYFCPQFTQAVATVRKDVFVGVLEDAGRPVGFFPFQRGRMGMGYPVGGKLSDFHGVIAAPEAVWDVESLLRGCGLSGFEFHYLLASQRPFEAGCTSVEDSHYIDLSMGFEAYATYLKQMGSDLIKDVGAKRRKLERESGSVRFEPHTPDPQVLRTLLSWKSQQYQRSGLVDVFSFDWTVALLERIHQTQTPGFAGMLSALYVNDEPVAVHLGMRSRRAWNWWFPRHDERFSRYSPGILLRIYAAEAAAGMGICRMDMGKGDASTYKVRLRSGGIPVAQGRVELPSLATAVRRARRKAEAWVRRSPLLPILRGPGRILARIERQARFR